MPLIKIGAGMYGTETSVIRVCDEYLLEDA